MSNSNPTSTLAPDAPAAMNAPALSRTNLILAIILVAQLAITAYLYWPSQGPITSGEPLLAGLTTGEVTSLTIADENERSVSFVKEGDTWTLSGTDGYPARETKITETLDKLLAIPSNRVVTQTDGSHDRLQVAEDNFLRKVDITGPDGTQTLYFGSSSGAAATHVRRADTPTTYLESDIATWELDTLETTWIDVTYFEVPKEQITEITVENANGTFTLVPIEGEEGGEWTLADATGGEPISSANINTFIDRITTLNLHSVLGKETSPDYGLESPLATITVTASDATTATTDAELTTTTLVVGAKDEERNTYYLKSSASDFYVRLAAFTGDEFVNQQRSDFMTQQDEGESDAGEATTPTVEGGTVVTGTNEVESQVTATSTLTTTESLTETETVTATDGVTATETITDTEAVDETETLTESESISASEVATTTTEAEVDATTTPTATVTSEE